MRKLFALMLVVFAVGLGTSSLMAQGLSANRGVVVVPDSTMERAEDVGLRAHTNHLIFVSSQPSPMASSPSGLSPATIRTAYKLSSSNTGGTGIIAIVDAYDYPTAETDFDVFATQFGLPLSTQNICNGSNPCFKRVYAGGSKPRANCGWAQEAALDIEWSHAMAPFAQIVLVEAKSNSFANLFAAVDVATNEVLCGNTTCPSTASGEGEVSMSWGGSEFSSEASNDTHFSNGKNIVYFASSGDTGGKTIYPSVSPNVVAAGGTTLNTSGGSFVSETGWSGSGGGTSAYEPIPTYQSVTAKLPGTNRLVPDFSFDADPNTGVSVYDSTSCQGLSGWLVFGGTSVASPSLSGIVNSAGHFLTNFTGAGGELTTIYANYTNSSYFRDITKGTAGSFSCTTGWDFVTGVGSDLGLAGK